jgi:2-isopropylmalate synthase
VDNLAGQHQDLIYDWNATERGGRRISSKKFEFYDETLRDGIQCPSVVDPTIDDKIRLVHLMDSLGIHWCDIGLPGAGPRAVEDVETLAREIVDNKLAIKPSCAARTVIKDIQPIVDVSQRVGVEIEVMAFIGSSPIRQYTENWDVELIRKRSADAIEFAVKNDLPCTFVTEDTTRSRPETLDTLFRSAIDKGARGLCLCDTVGHATPDGVRNLIKWTQRLIEGMGADVRVDWHGHNDRGLALENAIWAIEHGVDRVHGCAIGLGERVGNTPMDLLLLNLKLLGEIDTDLTDLLLYCRVASEATKRPIPVDYPFAGEDAFRTATGVHAAAIIKAVERGDEWLADRVYSGVPASLFGRKQEIQVGHMSGLSNVVWWLKSRRIEPKEPLVKEIFELAKRGNRILNDDEIMAVVDRHDRV